MPTATSGHPTADQSACCTEWKAATSEHYRDQPHEYVFRGKQMPVEAFDWLRTYIQKAPTGYRATWRGARYRYVEVGGHRYWAIWQVVNRCPVTQEWQ